VNRIGRTLAAQATNVLAHQFAAAGPYQNWGEDFDARPESGLAVPRGPDWALYSRRVIDWLMDATITGNRPRQSRACPCGDVASGRRRSISPIAVSESAVPTRLGCTGRHMQHDRSGNVSEDGVLENCYSRTSSNAGRGNRTAPGGLDNKCA